MCFCTPSRRTPFCPDCNQAMFLRIAEYRDTIAQQAELKQQRDELQQQLAGMTDSAKHFSGGMEYYRDLIDEAAKSIGIAMYTADDQGVHLEPLRAKLPECVAELVQQRDELLAALECIVPYIPKSSAADGGAVRYSAAVAAADVVRTAIAKVKEQK